VEYHLTHHTSLRIRVFSGNRLQWYDNETHNNQQKIHIGKHYLKPHAENSLDDLGCIQYQQKCCELKFCSPKVLTVHICLFCNNLWCAMFSDLAVTAVDCRHVNNNCENYCQCLKNLEKMQGLSRTGM